MYLRVNLLGLSCSSVSLVLVGLVTGESCSSVSLVLVGLVTGGSCSSVSLVLVGLETGGTWPHSLSGSLETCFFALFVGTLAF